MREISALALAYLSNEGPNQCFMGKNVRFGNAVCLIEAEIFAYPQNPRFPVVHHMRELEYISICL